MCGLGRSLLTDNNGRIKDPDQPPPIKGKSHAVSQHFVTALRTERKTEPLLKIHRAEFAHRRSVGSADPKNFREGERTGQPEKCGFATTRHQTEPLLVGLEMCAVAAF